MNLFLLSMVFVLSVSFEAIFSKLEEMNIKQNELLKIAKNAFERYVYSHWSTSFQSSIM
jgi:hypothetical protein